MLRVNGATKENATEEVRKLFEEQEEAARRDIEYRKGLRAQTDNSKRRTGFAARDSRLRSHPG